MRSLLPNGTAVILLLACLHAVAGALLVAPHCAEHRVPRLRCAPSCNGAAAEAPRWFVTVPRTVTAIGEQAARSVAGAAAAGQLRLAVECAVPELDPSSPSFRLIELVSLAHALALPLLEPRALPMPASRPMIKLLFSSTSDATLAGASILTTALPVSVLGHPSMIGPRDGAYVVVAPSVAERSVDAEGALRALLSTGRPVIVLNPRLGGGSAAMSDRKSVV